MKLNKNRLEAFSDGVIAIIITIMVFDLKLQDLPETASPQVLWNDIFALMPKIASYTLSFIVVAILWLNHHALFDKIPHIDNKLIWYNFILLFSMSLIPLPTAFLASHPYQYPSSMMYGSIMFLNACSFLLMRRYVEITAQLIPYQKAIHKSNLISTVLYLVSIPLSMVSVYLSFAIFILIPLRYFFPEKWHRQL